MNQRLDKANGLAAAGRLAEAAEAYRASLKANPGQAEAWYSLGNCLTSLGRREEALEAMERSLTLNPTSAAAWNNRGNILGDLRRPSEAVASFDESLRLRPGEPSTLNNRAHALNQARRPVEALAAYAQAHAAAPDFPYLDGAWLNARMKLCDWDGIDAHLARVCARIAKGEQVATPFLALGFTDEPALQAKACRAWAAGLGPPAPAPPLPAAGQRIRLAYFGGDFHNHAAAWLLAEHIELIDRQRFEVFCFSYGPSVTDSAIRERLKTGFDHFLDVRPLPDREIAALAREKGIEIAVEITGFSQNCRPQIMNARAAPIQVNYLSMPATMGMAAMDYIIADHVVFQPGEEIHFDEKVVRLPTCYQVSDRKREVSPRAFTRAELGLPAEGVVFCCFNNNYKFRPERFAVWMNILKGVPGSVLWLFQNDAASGSNLRREAARHGVDPGRLVFAPAMALPEHLARHVHADLFLDTAPYNAHTTANDALWMGVPVLTVPGGSFGSRVAASLLASVDLPELIAPDMAAYEAEAIRLGRDPAALAALKAKVLSRRTTGRGLDTERFTRDMERAYEAMLARRRAGLAPEALTFDD